MIMTHRNEELADTITYRLKRHNQAVEAILVALDVAENEGAISEIDRVLALTWVNNRMNM
jgi:hypothetical protein